MVFALAIQQTAEERKEECTTVLIYRQSDLPSAADFFMIDNVIATAGTTHRNRLVKRGGEMPQPLLLD